MITRRTATPEGRLRYKPWGETRYESGDTPASYRFTGQRLDSSLGLYHMGARWYDPALGRWLSADTIVPGPGNPQSLNRYSYVLGNPVVFIDPSGHAQVCNTAGTICSDDETEPRTRPGPLMQWPYQGDKPSGTYKGEQQEFGAPRDGGRSHEGMDIVVRSGDPKDPVQPFRVRAPVSGHVTAGKTARSGNLATIDQIPGQRGVTVWLMHMDVSAEGEVVAGQGIGTARRQGNATNDVLHLEVRFDGTPRDPMRYLTFPPGSCFDCTVSGAHYLVYVPPRESGLPSFGSIFGE